MSSNEFSNDVTGLSREVEPAGDDLSLSRVGSDLVGHFWKDEAGGTWTITFERSDGVVAAVRSGDKQSRDLGQFPDAAAFYEAFEGWGRVCGQPNSFLWAAEAAQGVPAEQRVEIERKPELEVLSYEETKALVRADQTALTTVEDHLLARRAELGDLSDEEVIRLGVARLEREAPQVSLEALHRLQMKEDVATRSTHGWVDTRLIVDTPDESWGRFDRRQDALSMLVNSLRTASDLRATLVDRFFARDPISMIRHQGPEGPMVAIDTGSHRTHTALILGMPALFGKVSDRGALPVVDLDRPSIRQRVAGLARVGLVDGSPDPEEPDRFRLAHAPAPWLLLPPGDAYPIVQAYERLYPGAHERLGLPSSALESRLAYGQWITALPGEPESPVDTDGLAAQEPPDDAPPPVERPAVRPRDRLRRLLGRRSTDELR